jgi:hypothetical protein
MYDDAVLPVWMGGNVFLNDARPSKYEKDAVVEKECDPGFALVEKGGGCTLKIRFDRTWSAERAEKLVTTEMLGRVANQNLRFEQPDGSPIRVATDYFGKQRNEANPTVGPFEEPGAGPLSLDVWRGQDGQAAEELR